MNVGMLEEIRAELVQCQRELYTYKTTYTVPGPGEPRETLTDYLKRASDDERVWLDAILSDRVGLLLGLYNPKREYVDAKTLCRFGAVCGLHARVQGLFLNFVGKSPVTQCVHAVTNLLIHLSRWLDTLALV